MQGNFYLLKSLMKLARPSIVLGMLKSESFDLKIRFHGRVMVNLPASSFTSHFTQLNFRCLLLALHFSGLV